MSIDLNTAPEQQRGLIPPDSLVTVRLHIRPPQEGRGGSTPGLTASQSSGLQYLNCEFEVLAGAFKGAKLWNNYNVTGAETSGQHKAVEISMRALRAMIEAARGILPKDATPEAAQGRRLQSWLELDNIIFPVQVDCEISQPDKNNKRYVNNIVKKIITPDHEAYANLMQGGEVITGNPLPQIDAATTQTGNPRPGWGENQKTAAGTSPQNAVQGSANAPRPAWGTPPQGQFQAPPSAFPSESARMDDVPF